MLRGDAIKSNLAPVVQVQLPLLSAAWGAAAVQAEAFAFCYERKENAFP